MKMLKKIPFLLLAAALMLGSISPAIAKEVVLHGMGIRLRLTGELDVTLYDNAGSPVISVANDGTIDDYSGFTGMNYDVKAERKDGVTVITVPVEFEGSLGLTANTANKGHIYAEEIYDEADEGRLIAKRGYRYVAGVSDTLRLADLYAGGIMSDGPETEEIDEQGRILRILVIVLAVLIAALAVPIIIMRAGGRKNEE